jgi:hypothetical protein
MNLADEHLLKALVLAPTLLNTIQINGDLPKSQIFVTWYRAKSATLKWGQYATSYEVAQCIFKIAPHVNNKEEHLRLGNQILNIMRGNGRRVT